MTSRILIAAAVALSLAGVAQAADQDNRTNSTRNCFRSRDWDSWRGLDPSTIILRVRGQQFWRIDLSSPSNMVTDQFNHLVNRVRGSNWICRPIDLDLRISSGRGVSQPLFVKALTRMTPEEVAALPRHARP